MTYWLSTGRTDLRAYERQWSHFIGVGHRIEAAELSNLQVQIGLAGNTAVATYLVHVRTRFANGRVTNEDHEDTDVWFNRGGGWKIVTVHDSMVPKKGAYTMDVGD